MRDSSLLCVCPSLILKIIVTSQLHDLSEVAATSADYYIQRLFPCTVYRIASVGKTEKRHTTQFPCIRHSHRMGSECVLCGFVRVFTVCIIFVSFISILYGASTAFMKLIFGYCVENGSGAVHRRCRVQLTKLINIDLWSTISLK